MVRTERESEVEDLANEKVDERLLDLLLPPPASTSASAESAAPAVTPDGDTASADRYKRTRDKLRQLLLDGQLDGREVEIEVTQSTPAPGGNVMTPGAPEGMDSIAEWFRDMMPKRKKKRTVKVSEARRILLDEELDKLIDLDDVTTDALERVEAMGIIFLDEIDKIAGERGQGGGPDVSREGVQRDLLPIVEGSTVQTRYGYVRTDHILFIAAGAFHVSKPSDLIPELQGRFPIRVELTPLTEADFIRIMTEPESALTRQYQALVAAEGAELVFTADGIAEVARVAWLANDRMENIGARRLHTVMSTLMDEVLFELPDYPEKRIVMDRTAVQGRLAKIIDNDDLRRYIL
jgi:ATP-dependent HslUV protease ATP-binding subunit HslU